MNFKLSYEIFLQRVVCFSFNNSQVSNYKIATLLFFFYRGRKNLLFIINLIEQKVVKWVVIMKHIRISHLFKQYYSSNEMTR